MLFKGSKRAVEMRFMPRNSNKRRNRARNRQQIEDKRRRSVEKMFMNSRKGDCKKHGGINISAVEI